MRIGVDYHPSFQQIAILMEENGEYEERRLNHSDGEAEKFYRDLKMRGVHVRVGMESTGYSRWFEPLLAELGFEVWIGNPAEIKSRREELTAAAEQEARKRPDVLRLMTHPGVGPLTALAYVLIIGTPSRFHRGKQIGNYVGMIPSEDDLRGLSRHKRTEKC